MTLHVQEGAVCPDCHDGAVLKRATCNYEVGKSCIVEECRQNGNGATFWKVLCCFVDDLKRLSSHRSDTHRLENKYLPNIPHYFYLPVYFWFVANQLLCLTIGCYQPVFKGFSPSFILTVRYCGGLGELGGLTWCKALPHVELDDRLKSLISRRIIEC